MLNISINIIVTLNPDSYTAIHPQRAVDSIGTIYIGQIGELDYVALERLAVINHVAGPVAITDKETMSTVSTSKNSDETLSREEQEDQQAFDVMSKQRGMPLETCLQLENQTEMDDIITVAPGENQRPLAFLTDSGFEELANPAKYPYGTAGFSTERNNTITVKKYFNQRILDADGRFAKDVEYLLAAQYIVESKRVRDESQIAMRQLRGLKFRGQNVTAGLLKNSGNMKGIMRTDSIQVLEECQRFASIMAEDFA